MQTVRYEVQTWRSTRWGDEGLILDEVTEEEAIEALSDCRNRYPNRKFQLVRYEIATTTTVMEA